MNVFIMNISCFMHSFLVKSCLFKKNLNDFSSDSNTLFFNEVKSKKQSLTTFYKIFKVFLYYLYFVKYDLFI